MNRRDEGPGAAADRRPAVPLGRGRRLSAVYGTLLRVLLSYGWFQLLGWLRGGEWVARRQARVHRRNARRVKATVLRVQGLFIKVGQLISILANALPAEFRGELEGLQDRIPPRPVADIRSRLLAELGAAPEELFEEFEDVALASASLAQVHRARLEDGTEVAVKVQHLDIEDTAELDLATMRRILAVVQLVLRIRGLEGVYGEVEAMIREELDFRREAEQLQTIAANFPEDPMISFPRVFEGRSSGRVLTTELIEGVKITDVEALDTQGVDRTALAERVLGAYCQMIFRDGVYHADPHPGNLLVRPDGSVVFLDFGAVARLSTAMREGIPAFLEGVLRRDTSKVLQALKQMGFVRQRRHDDGAERILDAFYHRFLERIELDSWNLGELRIDARMKVEMMADLRELGIGMGELTSTFQVPKEWVLLMRTLVLLLGICTELDPDLRPMPVLRPWVEEYVLGPEGDWMGLVASTLKDMALSALTLPGDLRKVLAEVQRGELRLRVGNLEASTALLYTLGHQFLAGLFALGTGGLAYHSHLRGDPLLTRAFAAASGLCLALLTLALFRGRKQRKRLRRGERKI